MKANFKLKNGNLYIESVGTTLVVEMYDGFGDLDDIAFEDIINVLFQLSEYRIKAIKEPTTKLNTVNLIKNLINLLPEADKLELINEIKGK